MERINAKPDAGRQPCAFVLLWAAALACTVVGSNGALAADVSVHAVLTSDYVYRGFSYSDEGPALQLGVDVESDAGFYAGVWGSTTDITTGNGKRSLEIDYYIGYVRYFDDDWSAALALNHYSYPGATGQFDYDYEELSFIVAYRERIWLEFDYTDAVFGHDAPARNLELLVSQPLGGQFSASFGAGIFDLTEWNGDIYWHWQAGVSRPIGPFMVDLRYFDTDRNPSSPVAEDLTDARIVLTLGVFF